MLTSWTPSGELLSLIAAKERNVTVFETLYVALPLTITVVTTSKEKHGVICFRTR